MAGTGVGKFSSTAGSNTANMTVNFAENMAPSNVNNAARELMGHMRDMYEQLGDGYFEFGDGDGTYTVARGDADTITLTSSADISSVYFPGRKIRITDGGANVVEGTIASSTHSSTTQTVNLTGISLASGTPTKVELGIDTAAFGGRVILDDDGDTYIEAPTDDTIDIYVAGAKDFVITANTFTAESGSTIAAQALTATSGTFSGTLKINDNVNFHAGTGDDLQIKHDGTNSLIRDVGAGDLIIEGENNIIIRSVTGSEKYIEAVLDGAVELFHNNVKKFETTADGITVSGLSAISSATPLIQFIETDQSNKQYNIGAGGSGFFIRDDSASQFRYTIDTNGNHVFNEGSQDCDFRVESNGNANMLFVDGGNDHVNIGTSSVVMSYIILDSLILSNSLRV